MNKFLPFFVIILVLVGITFVYGQSLGSRNVSTPSPSPTEIAEQPEDLLRKCGDITRDDFGITYGHFTKVTGPEWNSDCSYAALGMWHSGTSYAGDDPEEIKKFQEFAKQEQATRQRIQGIYLFNPDSRKSERIYVPKSDSESPEFVRWEGNDVIIFRGDQKNFRLNINTREAEEIN